LPAQPILPEAVPLARRRKSSPQLTLTGLWHLGVHCWYDGRVGPARTAERAMLRDMLDDLPERTLLVADAGFVGYELCAELIQRRIAFLLRVGPAGLATPKDRTAVRRADIQAGDHGADLESTTNCGRRRLKWFTALHGTRQGLAPINGSAQTPAC
jgi:Transposase DDE domain